MTEEFKQFLATIREGERKGHIKTSKPLTDFDIAVQFAIGKLGDEQGYPLSATPGEIQEAIIKHCGNVL